MIKQELEHIRIYVDTLREALLACHHIATEELLHKQPDDSAKRALQAIRIKARKALELPFVLEPRE